MSSSKKQKVLGYEWEAGETGVTIVMVNDPSYNFFPARGWHRGVTSIFVPETKLPYYAKVAMYRMGGWEHEWNILTTQTARRYFIANIEKKDYADWKQAGPFPPNVAEI